MDAGKSINFQGYFISLKWDFELGVMAHIYNPRYLEGGDGRNMV
jgi:hypothetical protein